MRPTETRPHSTDLAVYNPHRPTGKSLPLLLLHHLMASFLGWRHGVVVTGVRHERTSGPVSTWMGDRPRAGIPSRYVTSQLGQLSLQFLRGRLIEYQLRLG